MEFFSIFFIGYSGNSEIGSGSRFDVDAAINHVADLSGNECNISERSTGHAPGLCLADFDLIACSAFG